MSALRPLRGGCHCGRNRYIITIPEDRVQDAQVLFNTDASHQIPLATPLAAYLRVPLSWYRSTTYAFFPDETHSMIRRIYEHPSQQFSKRHFCGFCGTPLSYWSESPHTEAEYIQLTLGSLLREDMADLEDMGMVPSHSTSGGTSEGGDDEQGDSEEKNVSKLSSSGPSPSIPGERDPALALRQYSGVPWLDSLMEGSRLGNMRRRHGVERSQDGSTRLEWEIVEFDDGDDGGDVEMMSASSSTSTKRKRLGEDDMKV